MHKADLGTLVEAFFCKRLISQGRASPHTIAVETGKIVNRCSGRSLTVKGVGLDWQVKLMTESFKAHIVDSRPLE
jgi:hypothetical protein